MSESKPLIIKKIVKKGHGGHHGGSWKVAYADFVTAMMAFFLVMWLLAVSSEQGRASLSEYFNNLTLTEAVFNSGMPRNFDSGGPSVLDGGCFSPRPTGDEAEENSEEGGRTKAPVTPEDLTYLPPGQEGGEGGEQAGEQPFEGRDGPGSYQPTPAEVAKSRLSQELLEAAAKELPDISDSMQVEITPEGLRIQVVDREGRPMFNLGGANPSPEARRILQVIGQRLAKVSNKVTIEGHTDTTRFHSGKYGNWELSTARALSARMFLEESGLNQGRLLMVAGLADTQPLDQENPTDPINRRISILVHDQPKEEAPSAPSRPLAQPPSAAESPESARPAGPQAAPSPRIGLEELESNILENTLSPAKP